MKYQTFFYFISVLSVAKCIVDDKGHDLIDDNGHDDLHHNCTSTVEDNVNHLDDNDNDNSSRNHCAIATTSSSTTEITHSVNDRQTSSSILHFPIIPSLLFTVLLL